MASFLSQNWGKVSALLGLLLFVGLASFPLIERNFASDAPSGMKVEKEKGGWASAMMEKDKERKDHGLEVKSVLTLGDRIFVGTKMGLYEITDQKAEALSILPQQEVKHMGQVSATQAWLATKMGLYLFDGSRATEIYQGEVKSACLVPGKPWILVSKEQGLLQSMDQGKTWTPVNWFQPVTENLKSPEPKEKASEAYAKKN